MSTMENDDALYSQESSLLSTRQKKVSTGVYFNIYFLQMYNCYLIFFNNLECDMLENCVYYTVCK